MQNTIGKLREDEAEDGIMKKEEEYEVINISQMCIRDRLNVYGLYDNLKSKREQDELLEVWKI